tara:strand:+ start:2259 stop:2738 length:480 start_codon:yes stop_codon:yes gene_type:complete
MADIRFTVTKEDVKPKMMEVWEMANKGLQSGEPVIVTLGREKNKGTRLQENCYHAQCGDFAKQITPMGSKYDLETWKELLTWDFANEKMRMGEPLKKGNRWITSLCGTAMLPTRPSTKSFDKNIRSEFIEYLFAKGSEYGVEFTDHTLAEYEAYKGAKK